MIQIIKIILFFHSGVPIYEAAANTGNWDRKSLEADFSYLEKEHRNINRK
ncbi:MAG TPA: hypothetical protein VIM16_04900 [Mucilaginibacter sp.]